MSSISIRAINLQIEKALSIHPADSSVSDENKLRSLFDQMTTLAKDSKEEKLVGSIKGLLEKIKPSLSVEMQDQANSIIEVAANNLSCIHVSPSLVVTVPFEIRCQDPAIQIKAEKVFQALYSKEDFGSGAEACFFILDAFKKSFSKSSPLPIVISVGALDCESQFVFLDQTITINEDFFKRLDVELVGSEEVQSVMETILHGMAQAVYFTVALHTSEESDLQDKIGCTRQEYEDSFSKAASLISRDLRINFQLHGCPRSFFPLKMQMLFYFLPEIDAIRSVPSKEIVFSMFLARIVEMYCLFGKKYSIEEINKELLEIFPVGFRFLQNQIQEKSSVFQCPFKIKCSLELRPKIAKIVQILYSKEHFGVGKEACSFVLDAFFKIASSEYPISLSVHDLEEQTLGLFCFIESTIKLNKSLLESLTIEEMESEKFQDFMGTILHEMTHAIHYREFVTAVSFGASNEEFLKKEIGCTREQYEKAITKARMPKVYCQNLQWKAPGTLQEKIHFYFIPVMEHIDLGQLEVAFAEFLARIPQIYFLFGKSNSLEEIDSILKEIFPLGFQFFWNQFQGKN